MLKDEDFIGYPMYASDASKALGVVFEQEGDKHCPTVSLAELTKDYTPEHERYLLYIARIFHQWNAISHTKTLWEAHTRNTQIGIRGLGKAMHLPLQYESFRNSLDSLMLVEISLLADILHHGVDEKTALAVVESIQSPVTIKSRKRNENIFDELVNKHFGMNPKVASERFAKWKHFIGNPNVCSFFNSAIQTSAENGETNMVKTILDAPPEKFIRQIGMTWFLIEHVVELRGVQGALNILHETLYLEEAPSWEAWREYLDNSELHDMPVSWWSAIAA